ncbi:hypothetical protein EO98_13240 [Methanosarcina sp. 2.H.T.1A.6]|uniref:methyl-accepting chemotaxis protein n=1 Tax=unclassified Methanosarcina TaxID=2644672 RepID=UPI000621278D|nr:MULTISPECIES: methyl-accepting chemotaxis protein [unclassified Methanosarcina]KKG16653.1 hypothetical protein EO94_15220 [Methanosarcina sp. 2.H.T.1A.3]KKG21607.1 hypothetical protein EO98_13240 [Methanosarcina sp. 2.H.T.1A.6]KKG25338.1 hypothetical protein EO97_04410 [Methanosarcina sp. 2.H.T.1A.15]KKG27529.1 hypothetical protein EO96_11630 [Methanosarcina sp. 2.H.T.1A.8]
MVFKEDEQIQLEMLRSFVERISIGEKLEKISGNFKGDTKKTVDLINLTIENITGVLNEIQTVSKAETEGHLDIRADYSKYPGGWGTILKEINIGFDAVVGPLNVAAEYVERISRGDIPEPITENYKGDFNEIKNNLNTCIIAVNNLVEDAVVLSDAGVSGRLDSRADATRHEGDFRKIVSGVNATLDTVVGLIDHMSLPVMTIDTSFNILYMNETGSKLLGSTKKELIGKKCFSQFKTGDCQTQSCACAQAMEIICEVTGQTRAKPMGKELEISYTSIPILNQKGEVTGAFEFVQNQTASIKLTNYLNSEIEKLGTNLDKLSNGDTDLHFDVSKPDEYTTDAHKNFVQINEKLAQVNSTIKNLVSDSGMLVNAAIGGKLDTRADTSAHRGDFRKIMDGVNTTLDTLVGYIDRMPLPLQATDKSFNILYMNETGAKLLGSTKKELIGKKCYSLFNTGDCHTPNCPSARAMETVSEATSRTLAKPLGKEFELSTASIPILNQKGEVTGAFEFVQDQTALIRVTNYLNNEVEKLGNNLDKLSNGNTDLHIDVSKADEYTIDAHKNFVLINEKLAQVNSTIKNLVEDTRMLSDAAVNGALDTRADASQHPGDFRKIVEGVNDTLDAVMGPLNVAAEYVERISRGDIPEPITDNYKGDFNEIKNNLNTCIVAVNDLVSDAGLLADAATGGKLDTRADASRHEGDFRKIMEGFNGTLDTLVGYIDRMPLTLQAIDKSFNVLYMNETGAKLLGSTKKELVGKKCHSLFNTGDCHTPNCPCARAMESVSETTSRTQTKPLDKEYEISTAGIPIMNQKGEVTGAFEFVQDQTAVVRVANYLHSEVEKLGNNLDKLSNGNTDLHIDVSKADEYTIDAHKNFVLINEKLAQVNSTIKNLVEDTEMLSEAAIKGALDTRADASQHPGDFRRIVEGVNDTLDAVIGPLNVAAEYVERISRGDIPELIKENYNGDFNEIKNNLNTCIVAVNNLVEDAVMLSNAGIAGQLNTRADASRHEGDFRKVVSGVNDTLDAFIGPLREAIRVSNEFSDGNFRARLDEKLHVEGDFVNFKDVLNNIGISVSEVIGSTKSVTMQVVECSDEASRGADEVAKASEGVAISSQKSSELTRELLYKIEGINREIVDLSASTEKIAGKSKVILSVANEVVSIGKDAQVLGKDTNLKMASVEKIAKESVNGINNLTEQIKQIDNVIKLINDITSQINLLALNAAIEAARAGEHGRGFAVVAGEVKNLASKARNATDNIEIVVNSVQRDSKKTADAINAANKEIIDGVDSVNKTLDALNTIIINAAQVTKDIGEITEAIDNQAKISTKVVKASEEGNFMTREAQKESESLAAIAEETSAAIQEIGAAIHEVTDLSNSLKSDMEKYRI